MARKRHKPEEIVAKLRQVDVLTAQVKSVAEAVKRSCQVNSDWLRKAPSSSSRSGSGGRRRPRPVSFSPELAKGRSADQMGLEVEDVVDGGVSGEEPLS